MNNLRAVVETALSIFRTKRERAYARLRVSRGSATVGAWRLYARIVTVLDASRSYFDGRRFSDDHR